MNIDKILQVNTKIDIYLRRRQGEGGQNWGRSLIQSVERDTLSIMVPMRGGHVLYLSKDDPVTGLILADGARYAFHSLVIGKEEVDGIRYVRLTRPEQMWTSERREMVRIKTLISIRYEIISAEQEAFWEHIEPTIEATVTDLSGRGACITQRRPISSDLAMVVDLPLETKRGCSKVKILGKVVRCARDDDLFRIGVNFINITRQQEDLIMKYVFEMQRKHIQVDKGDCL